MKFGKVNEMQQKTEKEILELIKKIYGPDHECKAEEDCVHEVSDAAIREMTEQSKAQQG
jgi:hypothetical protein